VTNENQRAWLAGRINFDGCLIDLDNNVLDELGPDLCLLLSDLLFILFFLFSVNLRLLLLLKLDAQRLTIEPVNDRKRIR